MFFVFDHYGMFDRMIIPYYIEYSTETDCVLYVQDALGRFYTMTFPSRALLVEAMKMYKDTQKVSVRCEIAPYDPYGYRERNRIMQEQEQEQEEELEIEL